MPRRQTVNTTGIRRIPGIAANDAWAYYTCVRCSAPNFVHVGEALLHSDQAYETQKWTCGNCQYVHSKGAPLPKTTADGKELPYSTWGDFVDDTESVELERFWKAFFTIATENAGSYWKQCNTCGRIMPNTAFSRHVGWGPLEKQMECRACKAVINANLNPLRTAQQLHESSVRRRVADLLLSEENQRIDIAELFEKFGGKCFKTNKPLDVNDRSSWAIDHILPSKWLYPLTPKNAALLSTDANNNKRDRWPSDFYTNEELMRLAKITGANLALISSPEPVINPDINVDLCVTRYLSVRQSTDLARRIEQLKKLLEDYNLVDQLSAENKSLLGY